MTRFLARAAGLAALAAVAAYAAPAPELAERVAKLTRSTTWERREAIALHFPSHHPQGLVRIGDRFFMTSVEVITPTRRFAAPIDGLDRDAGKGVGHLFQFDRGGKLIADLTLGEGDLYHPGGLDYDGRYLWTAVAEYRPDSRSIVYRIDPHTMKATEMFRFADHLGALVHDTDDRSLHGVSWGSRTFYRWPLSRDGRVVNRAAQRTPNPSHYVDYQDCKYAGQHRMLCTGVSEYRVSPEAEPFRLGGIELVSLRDRRPLHQVPLSSWIRGLDLTHNPAWLETTDTGVRGYFVPEDDNSILYVYEANPEPLVPR